jgi:hypothetical protein
VRSPQLVRRCTTSEELKSCFRSRVGTAWIAFAVRFGACCSSHQPGIPRPGGHGLFTAEGFISSAARIPQGLGEH